MEKGENMEEKEEREKSKDEEEKQPLLRSLSRSVTVFEDLSSLSLVYISYLHQFV